MPAFNILMGCAKFNLKAVVADDNLNPWLHYGTKHKLLSHGFRYKLLKNQTMETNFGALPTEVV